MQRVQVACELAGFACLAVAAFLIAVPLGLALTGAALVFLGNARVGA